MSKDGLATLDRAVQQAIAIELGDKNEEADILEELGVEPKRTRIIAGVRVLRNASRDADVDDASAKMIDRMLRFQADRTIVLGKLKRVGIDPHAVIPLTAWNRICDEARLYRFAPQGDTVKIGGGQLVKRAASVLREYALEDYRGNALGWMVGCVLLFVVSLLIGIFLTAYAFWATALAAVAFVIHAIRYSEGPTIAPAQQVEKLKEIVAAQIKGRTIFQELWPRFVEPSEAGWPIKIELPMPPVEVQERIIALERTRHPLRIAVAEKGIVFKQSIAEALLGNHVDVAYEAPVSSEHDSDPIAYIVEGSAVAIIDPYGEVKLELETMQKVINSDHLV